MYSKLTSLFLIIFTIFVGSINPRVAMAAYAPLAPSMTVGGRQFVDLTNIIVISCYMGAGDSCTFRKNNAASGYQVTAGKTFVATAIEFHNPTAGAVGTAIPVYADNDIGFAGAVGSFSNPIFLAGGTSSTTMFSINGNTSGGNNGITSYSFLWQVPSGKFPGLRTSSAITNMAVFVYGYEQ